MDGGDSTGIQLFAHNNNWLRSNRELLSRDVEELQSMRLGSMLPAIATVLASACENACLVLDYYIVGERVTKLLDTDDHTGEAVFG